VVLPLDAGIGATRRGPRSALARGHVKLEKNFGDAYDLVTILNAYRTVYGNGQRDQ
jgi:hypothetical protein